MSSQPYLIFPQNLEGSRVVIRPFTAEDISTQYIAWLNDPKIVKYSNQRFRIHNLLSCTQYLESFSETDNLFLAITSKTNHELLGTMTAYVARHHKTVDVGIMIGTRNIWGQGIGQEAWNTLCNWLLNPDTGLRKITAGTASENIAMIRIMERSGMHREAIRRKQEIIGGLPVDLLYYARFANHA